VGGGGRRKIEGTMRQYLEVEEDVAEVCDAVEILHLLRPKALLERQDDLEEERGG
jgi:hypothetical protein